MRGPAAKRRTLPARCPDSVKVQLYADDEEYGNVVKLSESNDWTYIWTELDKYNDDGEIITYTAKEIDVPDGYKVSYEYEDGMTIITNRHRKSPFTGDASNTAMWIILLLASLSGIGFLTFLGRKERKDK